MKFVMNKAFLFLWEFSALTPAPWRWLYPPAPGTRSTAPAAHERHKKEPPWRTRAAISFIQLHDFNDNLKGKKQDQKKDIHQLHRLIYGDL